MKKFQNTENAKMWTLLSKTWKNIEKLENVKSTEYMKTKSLKIFQKHEKLLKSKKKLNILS